MSSGKSKVLQKNPSDVVICAAVRTAVTRVGAVPCSSPPSASADSSPFPLRRSLQARKGGFKDTLPEDLLCAVFKATLERSKIDPSLIEDIAVGNVLPPGGGANVARMAQLRAGIPNT